jgi:glycosyltransferase involved in cell wall biosynthesis
MWFILPLDNIQSTLKAKYGFPEKYILCVSRFDPHKNILRLLEAYKTLTKEGVEESLVFVGGRHMQEYGEKVDHLIESLGIKDKVFIAQHIEDGDIPLVYQGSKMLVFPSLYEGFGLPIIEALACGVPVVSSNIEALKEVSGGHGVFFDPYVVANIASGLKDGYRVEEDVLRAGMLWSTKFTWEKHGMVIRNLFLST